MDSDQARAETEARSGSNAGRPGDATGAEATAVSAATDPKRLEFELHRNAFYHGICETRASRLSGLLGMATILLGSSAVLSFGAGQPLVGQAAGAIVAGIGAVQIILDPSRQACRHGDLRARSYKLLSRLKAGGSAPGLEEELVLLYADEPPERPRIGRLAHNRAGELVYGEDFDRA